MDHWCGARMTKNAGYCVTAVDTSDTDLRANPSELKCAPSVERSRPWPLPSTAPLAARSPTGSCAAVRLLQAVVARCVAERLGADDGPRRPALRVPGGSPTTA
jgi:hypothetical protein